MGILGLQERVRSKLFLRRDRYGRFFSALVYIPRDRFNTDVRLRIEAMLKRDAPRRTRRHHRAARRIAAGAAAPDRAPARRRARARSTQPTLEAELAQIVRNWQDELRETLVAAPRRREGPEARRTATAARCRPATSKTVTPEHRRQRRRAAAALRRSGRPAPERCTARAARRGHAALQAVSASGDDIPLSDALPMMENMGLRVISEHPYQMDVGRQPRLHPGLRGRVARTARSTSTAATTPSRTRSRAIWRGDAENDGFNRLVLGAGLDWRQVAMLRGYCKYLLQTGVPFSQSVHGRDAHALSAAGAPAGRAVRGELRSVHAATRARPRSSRAWSASRAQLHALWPTATTPRWHVARSTVIDARAGDARTRRSKPTRDGAQGADGPRRQPRRGPHPAQLHRRDRRHAAHQLLSRQDGADGGPADYISFKFDSAKVPDLPKPRPYREIFVYGPRVEGVHLRFGPVARGGLRWSDRREDFRTEVLGLVKAQMVKNTVIVPVGAKGGFFVKQSPVRRRPRRVARRRRRLLPAVHQRPARHHRQPRRRQDRAAARTWCATTTTIRTWWSPPTRARRPSPTSPTASRVEHGFWLGDAFASGGSVGYDHKGMGITAKGAWESVKRHFRALGRDSPDARTSPASASATCPATCSATACCCRKHIRLLAAFDHRHIFLDPNPDAARSFDERERMFELPRSSWDDYDKSLISQGRRRVSALGRSRSRCRRKSSAALGIDDDVDADDRRTS